MNFIREHFKGFVGITTLLICTVAFIVSNEMLAQMLPDAQNLTYVSCELTDGEEYSYTGSEIEPEFASFTFVDENGEDVTVESGDFDVKAYMNNIEIGKADIEVALDDYRNTIVLEDVFEIVLGNVESVQITNASQEHVTLFWEAVPGADGYVVEKSANGGITFEELAKTAAVISTYKDTDVQVNSTYLYKVTAFYNEGSDVVYSAASEEVMHVTPLADPVAKNIKMKNQNSIEIVWDIVDGAVGYQVYRSTSEKGTYELVEEISDADVHSFIDKECEIGVTYFYYVVACQQVEEKMFYGNPSNIMSASTTPDRVSLSGSANEDLTSVVLKWKAVEEADGYEIYKKSGYGSYALIQSVTDETLTWSETDLSDSKAYSYKVRAFKMVDGRKVYGTYSGEFEKEKKVVNNYAGSISGGTGNITKYAGYSYKFGGSSTSGWDCSGFVQYVLRNEFGIEVARTAAGQASGGSVVSVSDRSSWKPGDILCYKKNGSYNHVAIYLGNGQMIHALNTKHDTIIQNVDTYEGWDDNNLAGVRRY